MKIDLYSILEDALRGKYISVEIEDDDGTTPLYYAGRVRAIGRCASSSVDIYFERDELHVYPGDDLPDEQQKYYLDLFALHMNQPIKILS